ncbi:hypothetical protein ACP4OV_031664 [Aristida adscensionis]
MSLDSASDGGDDGGGVKRRRVEDERGEQRDAAEAEVSRLLALPEELRLRILTHLPLKAAIRTGALARGWRGLWRSRWPHPSAVEVRLRSRADPPRELDALARDEPRPRRRLDRFSLVVEEGCDDLRSSDLRRFVAYAAERGAEDLHVDHRRDTASSRKPSFHLPLASPSLARLSLRGLAVAGIYYRAAAPPFHALEVIRLHRVSIAQAAFKRMMAACPALRTLDLRGCQGDGSLDYGASIRWSGATICWSGKLCSVTMVGCEGMHLGLGHVRSLRSFRYAGYADSDDDDSVRETPFNLPADLTDLYIYMGDRISIKCFPDDLSNLTVLTISNKALPVVASLFINDEPTAHGPMLSNLQSLRELQLLMFKMKGVNLANIYVFVKAVQLPNLERLFVQFPKDTCTTNKGICDEVQEEPPKDGLDSLKIVKVMNFSWRSRTQIKLVSFLMSKPRSLKKLLLVSPDVAPLDMLAVEDADVLLLKEALTSGKIMLSESDDDATQAYHSEVFLEI